MANDRVFIKCKYCGGWKMLLKFFPTYGSTSRDNGVMDWVNKHANCHPRIFNYDLGGDPGFTLHTESSLAYDEFDSSKQNYVP